MLRIPVLSLALVSCLVGVVPSALGQTLGSDETPEGLTTSDWSSIREAYEAGRHAARPAEDGYQVHNPGQAWRTYFDGSGFVTEPDGGGWSWGLELQRYGFAGRERAVVRPARVSAEGHRVAYDWDETLQEWYVNDSRGLEHGYTVHRRPAHQAREDECAEEQVPLMFTLAVRGELLPEVASDGHGVRFLDRDGVVVLTYSGLAVFDADGRSLRARFECAGDGLRLTVDESDARYPLTIDPIAQQAYLKASNTDLLDRFGNSVAVSGNTVVVGAYGEDSNAKGVNGDESDNSALDSGAAYVFVRSGVSWSQQAYLKASNTEVSDSFGFSVAVSGETVVVGAYREGSNATGVNGNQSDNSVPDAGAVYVFVRSGVSWSQQAYLKASNTEVSDLFGWSVAVSGDTLAIGARDEDSNATGVNGDQSDNSAVSAGAAYVFARSGVSWSQQAYLKASNTEEADFFGSSVAVSGDTVVIGAQLEDSNATGVNGNQSDNSSHDAGAAYVFVRSGVSWSQQAYLKASNTEAGDIFGSSAAVSGDTVIVGAVGEDSNATGVNGNQNDNSATGAGAAYVFVRSGVNWSQQAYLKASNPDAGDKFSWSVAVSGDTVVVGAVGEDSGANGVNGGQSDNSAGLAGAAYVFLRGGVNWSQQAYLKASNSDAGDVFGGSVAVSGDTVVVGAEGENSNATGVNGNQNDNSSAASGAAYVFQLPDSLWTDLGGGTPGIAGTPTFSGTGTLVGGTATQLTLTNAPPFAPALVWASFAPTPFPALSGTVHAFPFSAQVLLFTDATGGLSGTLSWPVGLLSATGVWFQVIVEDLSSIFGLTLSNGLLATTP